MAEETKESFGNLSAEILDKLYLLDFDKKFMAKNNIKPLISEYFSSKINQHEQFTTFKLLVKWLFTLNELESQDIDTYDDPNTVAQNIQHQLTKLELNVEVRASSIKAGYGRSVCEILLALLNKSLKSQRIKLRLPEFPHREEGGVIEMDMGNEIEELEFIGGNVAADDEDEEIGIADDIDNDRKAIESKANTKEWKVECNSVRNKLQMKNTFDQKEWRQHIEKAKLFSGDLLQIKPSIQISLEKLSDLLGNQLDKIMSREIQINKAMTNFGEELKNKNDDYKRLQDQINHLTKRIKALNDESSILSQKDEELKQKIQEQGNSATNDEPLIRLKKAKTDLQNEIKSMDIRIGVLNNIVWKHNFETKREQINHTLTGKRGDTAYDGLYNIMESPENMDDLEESED